MPEPVINTGTADEKTEDKKPLEEWQEVEELIIVYQSQFEDQTKKDDADTAMISLLERFYPLFKKYLILIKSSQINFNDPEMKRFVLNFIGDANLKAALKRKRQSATARNPIYQRFHFVTETYGSLDEDEIMSDLKFLFMILAKRYKRIGRSFCGYLYNTYCYEVARHIKKFIENPANIHYRNAEYEDYVQRSVDDMRIDDKPFEDRLFENELGIPDTGWIEGIGCSEIFEGLTPLERKLLVKYYLEDYNDRQVAEGFGMHINTVNSKRRTAAENLAAALGIDKSNIKRNRKSGKHVLKPIR